MRVLVTGATGFLGRRVVKALRGQGHQVRCLVHTPGRESVLGDDQLDIHYGSTGDPAALNAAMYDLDAVVHLVAIIRERKGATFEAVNHQGTRTVARIAAAAGVKQFIQVSAIGAQDNPIYPYLYSKWQGEQAVMACGIPYTILRPSLLFGPGDEFTNSLAGLIKAFPVVPIAGPGTNLFQPIAVEDTARCIASTVGQESFIGTTLEIGGPQHLSYLDIAHIICRTLGVRRTFLPLSLSLVQGAIRVLEAVLPYPPATSEQLRMVVLPNIAEPDVVERRFGFQPRPLEDNIDFVRTISAWDGLRIAIGLMPSRIRQR